MVTRMSDHFEVAGASWAYAALPEPFRTPLLGVIVGVRPQIDRGHVKQKLRRIARMRIVAGSPRNSGNAVNAVLQTGCLRCSMIEGGLCHR